MMNVKWTRRDFPILETGVAYMDNAASSLTPEPVLSKMMEFYHEYRSNVERGVHRLEQRAGEEYEKSRIKISNFINTKSSDEVIMTKNTSEGINLVASGLKWHRGDKIVTTSLEHHSNFIVWLRVKERYGIDLQVIKPSKEGKFSLSDFEEAVDEKTRLVAMSHVSNVFGGISPVKEVAELAHEHGALMLVDGAQSVPHMSVDVQKLGCDFLAFSGHKMCGPTGSGVLFIRKETQEEVEPLCIGGGTVDDVGLDYYRLVEGPKRFEAGTPAIAEVIGLGAAIDYLGQIGMRTIEEYERQLTIKLWSGLSEIPRIEVYGPSSEDRVGIVSFNLGSLSSHDVAIALDIASNVMVRSGYHCAIPLMKDLLRVPGGVVRASMYFYNTKKEVDRLLSVMAELSSSMA
ncbi:MAG: cysteine desulfurase / selenocysteine lyase [Thermoproteota archaeon]|nr:cysteine desulfurase / selenocysteine lyase [Thermoproteota archaeon]